MATSYTGLRVQDTYNAIIKIGDNSNLTATPKLLSDGLGNDSPLYLSGTRLGIGISPAYQFHTSGNAKIGGNLIVSGNLTVNGTLTYLNVQDLAVEDPIIKLAKDNTANTLDIGLFGKYVATGTKYKGFFNDASDDKFKLFIGTTVEPTTTVDTSASGYTVGTLVANLEGNVTGTVSSLSNHDTDDLSEGTTNLYFTTARARASFTEGTGVTITNGEIAIGQDVATDSNVTFGNITGSAISGTTGTFSSNTSITGDTTTPHSDNAFIVYRGSDGNTALRVQNSGEVVVQNNYLYASGAGTSLYVQNGAVIRGNISNDGGNVTVNDNLDVTGDVNVDGNLQVDGTIKDSDGDAGTSGQVLSSTGTGTNWIDLEADVAKRIDVTVKNVSGGSLTKGTVVHAAPTASPPSGNVIEVIAADANDAAKMPSIGVLNETIADEAEGEAVMFGAVSGIDTSSFSIGDELYVSETAGEFTATKPTAFASQVQKIAVVIKSHASNGLIKVFGAGRANDVPNRVDRDMNFTDDSVLSFGTGEDIKIYHNSTSTNANIENHTGHLYITNYADDKDIKFLSDNGTGGTEVYFELQGVSGGANPFTVFPDMSHLVFGSGHDFRFYHNGTSGNSNIENYTGSLYITNYADNEDIVFRTDNGSGSVTEYFRLDGSTNTIPFGRSPHIVDNVKLYFGNDTANDASIKWDSTASQLFIDGVTKFLSDVYFTGNAYFGDNDKLYFGDLTTPDLEIYHDVNNSFVDHVGTGALYLRGDTLNITSYTGTENYISMAVNGAVSLYDNNTVKLSTTSTGISVTGAGVFSGIVDVDGGQLNVTSSSGYGRIELGGASGGYIDLKAPASDDYDMRFITGQGGNEITTNSGDLKINTDNTLALTIDSSQNATFSGTITATGGSTNNNDDANILTLNASEHARLLVDTSSTDGHRATLALESNGNELLLTTTGSASELTSVGNLTVTSSATTFTGDVTADSFIKDGGTSSQYLMADGSVSTSAGVTGTGVNNRLAIWNGTTAIDSDSDFYVDGDTIFTTNFQASGNIGITGTSFLDGDVTIGDTNSAFIGMARAGANYLAATNASGYLVFRTAGSNERMRIDSSGNVGIGTTSPDGNLEVIASTTVSGASDSVNNVLIGLQAANRPTIILDTADTTYTNRTWNITNVGSAGSLFFGRNGLDVLVMKNDGKVGIGTTSPSSLLHIQGSTYNRVQTYFDGDYTSGFKFSDLNGGIWYDAGADDLILNSGHANSQMIFNTGGSESVRIDSSGDLTMQGGRIYLKESDLGNTAIALTRDADEGYVQLFSSGTQTIQIRGNGDTYFNGGSVGIGTTNPTQKLEVAGNVGVNGFITHNGDSGTFMGWSADDTNVFYTAGNERLRIDSDGKVGIGTDSPGSKLQVYSTATRDIFISGHGTQAQNTWQGEHAFFISAGQGVIIGKANAGNDTNRLHILYNTSNGDANYLGYNTSNVAKYKLSTNGNSYFNGGNVGIGTTSPSYKLEVNGGTALVGGGFYVSSDQVVVTTSTYTFRDGVYINNPNSTSAATTSNSVMSIGASSGNSVNTSLITTGAVGIGTTSPSTKLYVSGIATANGFRTVSGSTDYSLLTRNSSNTAVYIQQAGSGNIVDFRYGSQAAGQGTSAMYINSSGDATFASEITSGDDINVGGKLVCANVASDKKIAFRRTGANNFSIEHDTSSIYFYNETTGELPIRFFNNGNVSMIAGNVGINETAPATLLSLSGVKNTSIITLKSTTNNSSWSDGDKIGGINFYSEDGSGSGAGIKGSISYIAKSSSGGSTGITFRTSDSSNNDVERMFIDNSGVGIGTDSPSYKLHVNGSAQVDGTLYSDRVAAGIPMPSHIVDSYSATSGVFAGRFVYAGTSGSDCAMLLRLAGGSTAPSYVDFIYGSVQTGYITTNGSATFYGSASDYRLKENVVELNGALDRLDNLQPKRFNFTSTPEQTVDGFLAHEVADVVPEAIHGQKDAVNEDGEIIAQGIDQAKLVPLLVAAVQELRAEVELLKSQINS